MLDVMYKPIIYKCYAEDIKKTEIKKTQQNVVSKFQN